MNNEKVSDVFVIHTFKVPKISQRMKHPTTMLLLPPLLLPLLLLLLPPPMECAFGGHDLFTSLTQLRDLWEEDIAAVKHMREAIQAMEELKDVMERWGFSRTGVKRKVLYIRV